MTFWDDRYRGETYVYGEEPNEFLRAVASRIPHGRVVSLGEGEGRNAVFLASLGYAVTAVDSSAVGLHKAGLLAARHGVSIELVQADLEDYELPAGLSGVVSIFLHVQAALRKRLLTRLPDVLVPGGVFVLESYRPEQLALGTGGPRDAALLPTLAELKTELSPLDLEIAAEVDREIHEGTFHDGPSATVQIVGRRKPARVA